MGLNVNPRFNEILADALERQKAEQEAEHFADVSKKDTISRQAAIEIVRVRCARIPTMAIRAMQEIKDLPAEEPERKRGRWEKVKGIEGAYDFRCSACHRFRFHNGEYLRKYNFCPNCGALMEKGGEQT